VGATLEVKGYGQRPQPKAAYAKPIAPEVVRRKAETTWSLWIKGTMNLVLDLYLPLQLVKKER